MNVLDYPLCLATPRRLTSASAWHQHLPFGMFLVQLLEPKVIVELGTQRGDSYCAFCQAVSESGLNTVCYAIDTWQGDLHAGQYGSEVLEDLRLHHDTFYGSFSTLIQSTFDEALLQFEDGTIDLLHIDGYHTYEAVRHDFESWKPKLSSRSVILFHDINVREREFGVWRLWEEIKAVYPHFEFFHGHGLGVLAVGTEQSDKFKKWLTDEHGVEMRAFFFALGERLDLLLGEGTPRYREALEKKDEHIARLQAFSDAVRRTWAFQFYRTVVKPFTSLDH